MSHSNTPLYTQVTDAGFAPIRDAIAEKEGLTIEGFKDRKRQIRLRLEEARVEFQKKVFENLLCMIKWFILFVLTVASAYFSLIAYFEGFDQLKLEFLSFLELLIVLVLGALLSLVFTKF